MAQLVSTLTRNAFGTVVTVKAVVDGAGRRRTDGFVGGRVVACFAEIAGGVGVTGFTEPDLAEIYQALFAMCGVYAKAGLA